VLGNLLSTAAHVNTWLRVRASWLVPCTEGVGEGLKERKSLRLLMHLLQPRLRAEVQQNAMLSKTG
jgi:hypothetical protein